MATIILLNHDPGLDKSINKHDLEISGVLFDGMAVVNEQVIFKDAIKNCKDLADHVVCAVQRKSYSYTGAYAVFDDYSVESSLKETTRKCIKDFINFLSSTQTKIG